MGYRCSDELINLAVINIDGQWFQRIINGMQFIQTPYYIA